MKNLFRKFGLNPKTAKPGELLQAAKAHPKGVHPKKRKFTSTSQHRQEGKKVDNVKSSKHKEHSASSIKGMREFVNEEAKEKKHSKHHKGMCKTCGKAHPTKKHKGLKLVPPSKGHAPKGAHGRAAVKQLGRTKTTGNFARIEASKGKGAAISAFQNARRAHLSGK
jgi:hypothetical protein